MTTSSEDLKPSLRRRSKRKCPSLSKRQSPKNTKTSSSIKVGSLTIISLKRATGTKSSRLRRKKNRMKTPWLFKILNKSNLNKTRKPTIRWRCLKKRKSSNRASRKRTYGDKNCKNWKRKN